MKPQYKHLGFDYSVERVLKVEGGYGNHKDDTGGETNLGITKDTAIANKDLWPKFNWDGNMRTLPREFAKAVYKRQFWDKVMGDKVFEIHPLLSDHLFDVAVNAGTGAAVKQLQRALNTLNNKQTIYKDIGVDGAMGPGTLASLRAFANKRGEEGLEMLVFYLVASQVVFYRDITEKREANESFMFGWLGRGYNKMAAYMNLIEGDV